LSDPLIDENVGHSLWQDSQQLVEPKEDEADWFRAFGNSQRLVYPMRRAAELWKPDGEWKIMEGDWHSALISQEYSLRVFDILANDPHLILCATKKALDPTSASYQSAPHPYQREIDNEIPF
jgi:hypothetical protein